MNQRFRRFVGLVALVCLAPSPAVAQRFTDVSAAIQKLVDAGELPSVAVAVARDGRIVWEEGFGWADRELRIAATADTPYSLASISKPFTATAVMKLVEAGRLELDRPANEYLADARITGPSAERATVRHILSHTAGLPMYYRPLFGESASFEETIQKRALIGSPPGRRYIYSNLGYGILDHIIGRVTGASYEAFMQREVFEPLRLGTAMVAATAGPSNGAVRYEADGKPLAFYDLDHRGASSIYASARDLVRFGMFHLKAAMEGEPILQRGSIDEMQRLQVRTGPGDGYGLGWRIEEDQHGLRHVGHTGGMPGVTTVLSLYPSERTVVVVLANRRSDAVIRLGRAVAGAAMPRYAWRLRTSE